MDERNAVAELRARLARAEELAEAATDAVQTLSACECVECGAESPTPHNRWCSVGKLAAALARLEVSRG